MGKIVLKTANRTTRVSRLKVRKAVAAVYSGDGKAAAVNEPVVTVRKKAVSKKAAIVKNADDKAVGVTKSKSSDSTSFPKKVKAMNVLLAKATLVSE
jgi:hypothetical protein